MRKEIYIVASIGEIQTLVAGFLGNPGYSTLLDDLRAAPGSVEWFSEGVQQFEVVPPAEWIADNHQKFIADVRENGRVEWDWELEAVLNQLAEMNVIETGNYLIEVY